MVLNIELDVFQIEHDGRIVYISIKRVSSQYSYFNHHICTAHRTNHGNKQCILVVVVVVSDGSGTQNLEFRILEHPWRNGGLKESWTKNFLIVLPNISLFFKVESTEGATKVGKIIKNLAKNEEKPISSCLKRILLLIPE